MYPADPLILVSLYLLQAMQYSTTGHLGPVLYLWTHPALHLCPVDPHSHV